MKPSLLLLLVGVMALMLFVLDVDGQVPSTTKKAPHTTKKKATTHKVTTHKVTTKKVTTHKVTTKKAAGATTKKGGGGEGGLKTTYIGTIPSKAGGTSGTVVIPTDWATHCMSDYTWCMSFIYKVVSALAMPRLFPDYKEPALSPAQEEEIKAQCGSDKDKCDELRSMAIATESWIFAQRALGVTEDSTSGTWVIAGSILLVVILVTLLTCWYCFFRPRKGRASGHHGRSKSKSGRSKSHSAKKRVRSGGSIRSGSRASRKSRKSIGGIKPRSSKKSASRIKSRKSAGGSRRPSRLRSKSSKKSLRAKSQLAKRSKSAGRRGSLGTKSRRTLKSSRKTASRTSQKKK